MTVSELFRMLSSFLIFLHARCKSEFSVFYLRMARAVFEGTNMVNAKRSNAHYRSWPVEQRAKALVFKKNRRSQPRKSLGNVKSRSQL